MTDDFEKLLRRTLGARPEHVARLDLVEASLARAQVMQQQEERIARMARLVLWRTIATTAAALLVVLTLIVGYILWPTSADSISAATTTTSTIDWTTVGIVSVLAAIVFATFLMLLTPERQNFRLALA